MLDAMKDRKRDLLFGFIMTALVCSLIFIPYANINRIMFLIFLLGGALGFITALSVPFKKCAERGFLWAHYIPLTLQISILYYSDYRFLSYIFLAVMAILLLKNIIGLYFYRDKMFI